MIYMSENGDGTDKNVLGEELEPCSEDPMTGYARDGLCRQVDGDRGRHHICAKMTAEFLEYSKSKGNDLTTPKPQFDFPGLEPGDFWCVCVPRWLEAYEDDVAPPVDLAATSRAVLEDIPLDVLRENAVEK
jgi:uncharacterized protein (DUF2237 family)